MRPPVIRAAIIVFTASFCTLVIELVAGRVLAPHVGVSLYTWTSIIGVVLAGISAGAYAGGWVADRRPAASTLGWLLFAAGVTAIAIAPATSILAGDEGLLTTLGIARTLLARVVALAFLLFFLPSFFLGMISPVAVKLAVRDLDTAGRTVGKIYAFSTLGSIAGTFVTGFWLVAAFGTRSTLIGTGVVLIAAALLLGDLLGRRGRVYSVLVLGSGAVFAYSQQKPPLPPYHDPVLHAGIGTVHFEESQYYTIRVERTVREDNGAAINSLHLDHLVHSYSDPNDLAYLEYDYLRAFMHVVRDVAARRPDFRLLFVGGGGYTLPRLVEREYPHARVDVAEIDPAVTRVARRWFGLSRNGRMRTINQDARWFAMRAPEEGVYDAIFIDAFNDLSVPYHLTTRELTQRLHELLRADGVLAANVIDDYGKGRFLASYVRTLQSVFGAPKVAVVMELREDMKSDRSTFVVAGTRGGMPSFRGAYVLPHEELQSYVAGRDAIVLTDDYAPVDNMLAPLFTQRFADEVAE
ncbi:MAG TPA: fused MFS/spermidine synthase [Thermoanaerobaculia bacterium]|nr:fused MFS/spermidine synthase [Thermoanaerobaculia bacterium]